MTALAIGERIGQGMTAEVFEAGDGRVLKLYRTWVSRDGIRRETGNGRAVHAAGVPSPAVLGEVEHEGRFGVLLERVPGESMLGCLQRKPWRASRFGRELARMHFRVHAFDSTEILSQREWLTQGIERSAKILGDRMTRVLASLEALPEGKTVCHGDFHPDNILLQGVKAIPIDWMNAFSGNPAADVVRTSLMLRSPFLPPGAPVWMSLFAGKVKRAMLDAYLEEYRRLSGMRRDELEQFVLPVAAARLHENIPGEREWLLDLVDHALTKDETE